MFGPESNLLEHLVVGIWWILMFLMLFVLTFGIAYLGVREDNQKAEDLAEVIPAGAPLKMRIKKRKS
jgi:hypothetical protein